MAETDPAAEDLQQGGWKRPEELRPDELAAREETSYGLALFPDLVEQGALSPGRGDSAWSDARPPLYELRHPGVCFDPADPLFAQMGADARTASAERGRRGWPCSSNTWRQSSTPTSPPPKGDRIPLAAPVTGEVEPD